MNMIKCLVIWRDNGSVFIHSKVNVPANIAETLNSNDWIRLAAKSEVCSENEINDLIENGYELIFVSTMPEKVFL